MKILMKILIPKCRRLYQDVCFVWCVLYVLPYVCFSLQWCWSLDLKSKSGCYACFISCHKVLPASAGCSYSYTKRSKLMLWFLCIYSFLNPAFLRFSMSFFFSFFCFYSHISLYVCVFLRLNEWSAFLFSFVMEIRLRDPNSIAWPFVTPVDSQTNFSSDSSVISDPWLTELLLF